jgi:hypothetical protein
MDIYQYLKCTRHCAKLEERQWNTKIFSAIQARTVRPQERQTCVQTCTSQGSRVGGSVKGIIFIVIFTGGCPWHLTRQNLSDLCHTVSQWDQTQDQPRGANAQPCLLRIIPLERKVLEVGPGHTPLQLFPHACQGRRALARLGGKLQWEEAGVICLLLPMSPVTTHYGRIRCRLFFFETGSPYVAQADPEFEIFLSQPPKCWDYRKRATMPSLGTDSSVWLLISSPSSPTWGHISPTLAHLPACFPLWETRICLYFPQIGRIVELKTIKKQMQGKLSAPPFAYKQDIDLQRQKHSAISLPGRTKYSHRKAFHFFLESLNAP